MRQTCIFLIIGHFFESNSMVKHWGFYCVIATSYLREKYEFLEFPREYTQVFQHKCFENKGHAYYIGCNGPMVFGKTSELQFQINSKNKR